MKNKTLIEKREKWIGKWLQKKLTGRAIAELKQQDKKFIKEILNEIRNEVGFQDRTEGDRCMNIIKQKAGEELTK